MALTPQNNDAFFREVDEELRRSHMIGAWRRYGRVAVVGAVVLLLALAAFLWWRHQQGEKAGADGEQLTQIIADLGEDKEQGVQPKLDALAKSERDGYRAAARLTSAGLALQKGEDKAAVTQFGAVAADTTLPPPFRDLALIRQTAAEFDTLPPATIVTRLKPIAVAGNPWFGSAGEMMAAAYLKMNKPELAGPILAAIAKDETTPDSIRSRAVRLASGLGIDVVPQTNSGGED